MTANMRSVLNLAAAAMLLDMAFASVAPAQDAMQRDQMFRDSLLRRTPPQERTGDGLPDKGWRQEAGAAQEPIKAARRHPRQRHREKT